MHNVTNTHCLKIAGSLPNAVMTHDTFPACSFNAHSSSAADLTAIIQSKGFNAMGTLRGRISGLFCSSISFLAQSVTIYQRGKRVVARTATALLLARRLSGGV